MTKTIQELLLYSSVLFTFPVLSSQPDFNYLEIKTGKKKDYETYDLNNFNGKYSITDEIYISAEFERYDLEEHTKTDIYSLGAGYVFSLDSTSNLYLQLDYTNRQKDSEY